MFCKRRFGSVQVLAYFLPSCSARFLAKPGFWFGLFLLGLGSLVSLLSLCRLRVPDKISEFFMPVFTQTGVLMESRDSEGVPFASLERL